MFIKDDLSFNDEDDVIKHNNKKNKNDQLYFLIILINRIKERILELLILQNETIISKKFVE